jgi:hypothetical protein
VSVDVPDWNLPSLLMGAQQLLGTVKVSDGPLVAFAVPVGTTSVGVLPTTGNGVTIGGFPSGRQLNPAGQPQPAGVISWAAFNVQGDTQVRITVSGLPADSAAVFAFAPPPPLSTAGASWAVLNAVTWVALTKQTIVAPVAGTRILLHQAELQVQAAGGLRLVLYEVTSGKGLLYLASSVVGQVVQEFEGLDLGIGAELGTISDGAPSGSAVVTYTQV